MSSDDINERNDAASDESELWQPGPELQVSLAIVQTAYTWVKRALVLFLQPGISRQTNFTELIIHISVALHGLDSVLWAAGRWEPVVEIERQPEADGRCWWLGAGAEFAAWQAASVAVRQSMDSVSAADFGDASFQLVDAVRGLCDRCKRWCVEIDSMVSGGHYR